MYRQYIEPGDFTDRHHKGRSVDDRPSDSWLCAAAVSPKLGSVHHVDRPVNYVRQCRRDFVGLLVHLLEFIEGGIVGCCIGRGLVEFATKVSGHLELRRSGTVSGASARR